MSAIELQSVSKSFHWHSGRLLMRHRLTNWLRGRHGSLFQALKDVSFELKEGEGLAVVGPNGAGKSTLLGLVAGLATPDSGSVTVNGRVAALLELGSGFHPDLTGAENVRVNASLMGLSRRRTAEMFDQIVEFADIGDFIGEPLRTYSTGMVMRLAFSVAIVMDPEILLIDEVLGVGDHAFQAKCFERLHQFRRAGGTLLCVSHAAVMVQELCDRAIWLDRGVLVMSGRIRDVIEAYEGHGTAVKPTETPGI
jgi:ABC-type polysaccharide/polyol phosphate transport system ATPase subunit